MDHWGDPWADNADEQKPATKNEVTSPQPPLHAPTPVLLNGFLDDAGWGNDDGFGDWATSSGNDATATDTRIADPSPLRHDGGIEVAPHWDVEERKDALTQPGGDDWAGQVQHAPDADNGSSEPSDTSTTVPLDPAYPIKPASHLQPDDDSSARPSTAPSETSRNDVPTESPRTSTEEESGVAKASQAEQSLGEDATRLDTEGDEDSDTEAESIDSEDAGEQFGTSTEDTLLTDETSGQAETAQDAVSQSEQAADNSSTARTALPTDSPSTTIANSVGIGAYSLDPSLLDNLFPPHLNVEELDEAPDDPLHSIPGRKAWYRLTRKQTMREFNSGNGEDNYIRVTWAGSQVRTEVNKIVGRWAREDRLSGTGAGARASFYWDTAAPMDPKVPSGHSRTKTSVPAPRAVAPSRHSLPPSTANAPAAFNWSSASAEVDLWKQNGSGLRSVSSPIAQKHTARDDILAQAPRAVSVHLTPRNIEEMHMPTLAAANETPLVARVIAPPVTHAPATSSDSWGKLDTLATDTPVQEQNANANAPIDDDDDWGEMISSPTVSTPIAVQSTATSRDNTVSTPQTLPTQGHPADTMHAASIVRLRSTISPTSAIFGAKSFVPLFAEQAPIGPGILKPTNRPVASTPEKTKHGIPPPFTAFTSNTSQSDPARPSTPPPAAPVPTEPIAEAWAEPQDDGFSAFTSSTLPTEPARPSTPPPPAAVPVEPSVDSWADADFSFFESAPPTTAPVLAHPKHEPSDPFSVSTTPPRSKGAAYSSRSRSTSVASSAKTFTRSPPRNLTPPPVQPLTGATNAAQRRKNEEEQVISNVLAGLPNLNYMLR
ncbi:hypothetical protein EJ02DRAFT_359318 [Clathrospora elynae]|uniref:Glucan 1, 4-alpha-glucosidase n=1 Tax=Clathrospora elynae TaxID=706981 RepID=A0A6A5SG18_9PLEO|nr:hypothetical protein EJ02DRAFT_359318 [Clathrospora elynae]